MVQNLALPGGTTYAGTYSNFPSGGSTFELPVSSTSGWTDNSTKYVFNGWHIGQGDSNGNILTHTQADSYTTDENGKANGGNTGGYYSYPVAAATELGNQTSTNYNTLYSICPRNWRLPSAADSNGASTPGGDIGELTDGYLKSFDTWYEDALTGSTNFNLFQNGWTSWCYSYGCPHSGGLGGYSFWWSSTVYTRTNARGLGANSSFGIGTNNNLRYLGYSIRCVVGGLWGGQADFTYVIFSCLSLHNCCKKYNTFATSTS